MTVLIDAPRQTKKTLKDFFKRRKETFTNLDWCKWGGWFDTDGDFYARPDLSVYASRLRLKDRQPIELFSKTFEVSLAYYEHMTKTPERSGENWIVKSKKYLSTTFSGVLNGDKSKWFTKNVYPYLLNEEKKDYAVKLLGYRPQSKDIETWTQEEIINYLGSAIGGDGSVSLYQSTAKFPHIDMKLISSDSRYLSEVKYVIENTFKIYLPLAERFIYHTAEGEKISYHLRFFGSRKNPENLPVFESLVKDNVMSLDRKKNRIQEFITLYAA